MRIAKQKRLPRGAGILLPVSSLPSPYGIGTMGAEALRFVDFLREAGLRWWQMLPVGPTSYGDSPYQSFSAFAGNPYFIDLDTLVEEGLLVREEITCRDWGAEPACVDYARLYGARFAVLRAAYARADLTAREYLQFCEDNAAWLDDYALFMAIKERMGGKSWQQWPDDIRLRTPDALERRTMELHGEIDFWKFCQYQFCRQWERLRAYAAQNGVRLIGDIPIYVALDSADVWAAPEQYRLDGDRRPVEVAGVPPDMFSATGQLWGNPLYDWAAMQRDGFTWWKRRMRHCADMFDMIRIDHFIGTVRYYAIPAADDTAANGVWRTGPGEKLIAAIGGAAPDARIIAEDLGLVTPAVIRLRDRAGYPGMKLLEMGFDSGPGNANLPHHYAPGCVVYGGTHDNQTLAGYIAGADAATWRFARQYLDITQKRQFPWAVIRAAYASVADTAIFQMQDYLELGDGARMNTPSTLGDNWRWRLVPGQLTHNLAQRICDMARTYGRCAHEQQEG